MLVFELDSRNGICLSSHHTYHVTKSVMLLSGDLVGSVESSSAGRKIGVVEILLFSSSHAPYGSCFE